ncbi:MAG: 1-acyl-sn-glycerol-3-phosphate acyltransferase [Oscillospiraceae bacterium]|nr:1-acyl-sn-glycerol-3-phosphate acyltransferase [Oscillospiraceae bacterium]
MLVKTVTLLALVAAAIVCALCGGFSGLGWIWMLPVFFGLAWLVGAALSLLWLWLLCRRVDLTKEQEEDDPFYRKWMYIYIEALINLLQVRTKTVGLEKTPRDGRFLLVCNHLFIADPGIIHHYFRDSQLAFISKKENENLPAVAHFMHRTLCQSIDREDDRQALQVILKCIRIIKDDKASVCVFPEGATSKDGRLHHFRPGVFKIAQKANVPIVVCTLRNTKPILHNGFRLKHTDVELRLLEVIPAADLKGRTAVDISEQVHKIMADDLGPDLVAEE